MTKNILITGATGNLGTAVVAKFLSEGCRVIGTVQHGHPIPNNGADYYACDLAESADTKSLFDHLKSTYKTINAGIFLVGGFTTGSIESADGNAMTNMLKLNYITAYNCAHHTYSWMKQSYGGTIIFVGSKPAIEGGTTQVLPYAISKKAVVELAHAINETGEDSKIHAKIIVPSIIDTPENRQAMPTANFSDWVTPGSIADKIYSLVTEGGDSITKIYNNA